eukprot:COSAG06_NODE_1320_length_9872_cov_49.877213_1_plen_50_part_10
MNDMKLMIFLNNGAVCACACVFFVCCVVVQDLYRVPSRTKVTRQAAPAAA